MKLNHTPGPWIARWLPDPDVTEVYICAVDAHDKLEEHSIYEGGPTCADPAENLANMNLMAAAPEMFAALRYNLDSCCGYDAIDPCPPCAKSRSAIYAALGEMEAA